MVGSFLKAQYGFEIKDIMIDIVDYDNGNYLRVWDSYVPAVKEILKQIKIKFFFDEELNSLAAKLYALIGNDVDHVIEITTPVYDGCHYSKWELGILRNGYFDNICGFDIVEN